MLATSHSICAVVPAAGRGSRLGGNIPKVFVPILPSLTVWDALHRQLVNVADRIVLVLSPQGNAYVAENREQLGEDRFRNTTISIQREPKGMGDAVFCVADEWRGCDVLLVVWGDQFNVSLQTLQECLRIHTAHPSPTVTLPLVSVANPYVEYVFDARQQLVAVRQSREGDACAPGGLADVGVFVLTGGDQLIDAWTRYQAGSLISRQTREVNFLPFLTYLSTNVGWSVLQYQSTNPAEALGINTVEDLTLARQILSCD